MIFCSIAYIQAAIRALETAIGFCQLDKLEIRTDSMYTLNGMLSKTFANEKIRLEKCPRKISKDAYCGVDLTIVLMP